MMGGRGAALTSGSTGLSRGLEHRPGIDGLRALAVAAVVAFHLDRLPGGNLGVDAFFVISGWLITSQLLASVAPGSRRLDLAGFWSARVRRLLPASALTLVAIAVVWTALDIDVPSLRRDITWALGWGANWGTITDGGDYWARFGEASPVAHFWSLAVEEQFYLGWPLVLWVMVRRGGGTRRVGWTAAVLAIASVATMVVLFDPANPTATYLHTGARAHSLLLGAGAAAATIAARSRPWLRTSLRWLLPPAVATSLAIIIVSDEGSSWLYRWGFPTYAAAVAIIVMCVAEGTGRGWLSHPLLRWIGDRSYAIYLWHWPVILLLSPSRLSVAAPTRDVVAVAATLALAAASHRWLEQPIRRSTRVTWVWAPGIAVGTLAACLLVLGLSAPTASRTALQAASTVTLPPPPASGPATTGTSGPGSTSVAQLEVEVLAAYVTAPPTTSPSPATAPAPPAALRALVVGDSTAVQLAGALVPMAGDQPEQLIVGSAAFPGCGLTAADDGRLHASTRADGTTELTDLSGCVHQWKTLEHRIVAEAVDVVLVDIGAWDGTDIHLADGRVVSIVDFEGRQLITDAYRRFVAGVEAAGARVVWVLPPDLDVQWGYLDSVLDEPARWVAMRAVIHRLGVEEIDLHGWLQDQALGGPDARPDGVHLTQALNERFVREVAIPRLLALRSDPQAG